MLKINLGAEKIINTLQSNSFEGYVVGGCVRDLLLNKQPKDWDITTNAKPEQIKRLFNKTTEMVELSFIIVVRIWAVCLREPPGDEKRSHYPRGGPWTYSGIYCGNGFADQRQRKTARQD